MQELQVVSHQRHSGARGELISLFLIANELKTYMNIVNKKSFHTPTTIAFNKIYP